VPGGIARGDPRSHLHGGGLELGAGSALHGFPAPPRNACVAVLAGDWRYARSYHACMAAYAQCNQETIEMHAWWCRTGQGVADAHTRSLSAPSPLFGSRCVGGRADQGVAGGRPTTSAEVRLMHGVIPGIRECANAFSRVSSIPHLWRCWPGVPLAGFADVNP
jgi:hypothetical protein